MSFWISALFIFKVSVTLPFAKTSNAEAVPFSNGWKNASIVKKRSLLPYENTQFVLKMRRRLVQSFDVVFMRIEEWFQIIANSLMTGRAGEQESGITSPHRKE